MSDELRKSPRAFLCTGCGENVSDFTEGWCLDCYYAQFASWEEMSDRVRLDEIRRAL